MSATLSLHYEVSTISGGISTGIGSMHSPASITTSSHLMYAGREFVGSLDTEIPAANYRLLLDLTGFTQYRATLRVATQGAVNSDLRFQGSTDDVTFANLDGSTGPEIAIGSVGEKNTGWVTLAAPYRTNNVRIRVMGKDGDGVADPVVRQVMLHFK